MSKFGKQGHNKNRYKRHDGGRILKTPVVGQQAKEVLDAIDESCPTIQLFKKYAEEMDSKHDKYERIVKISRDVTIESKRIIFLLHTIDSRENKKEAVLKEAKSRLDALISQHYYLMARELDGQDCFLYHRAFSGGLQEFIEAFTFYDYLSREEFDHWDVYQKKLTYEISDRPVKSVAEVFAANSKSPPDPPSTKTVVAYIPPLDFILGLADLSGELMRKCINNLGAGDIDGCYKTCNIVRKLYIGLQSIGPNRNKEMSHKAFTLRQSLLKMEMVCYNIHVRGTEIPKHMLADVLTHEEYGDEDEGYFN